MGAAGCEDEELEFKLIFGEDSDPPSQMGQQSTTDLESDSPSPYTCLNLDHPTLTVNQPIGIPCHGISNRMGMHSPPPRPLLDKDFNGTFESQPARYIDLGGSRILECPSIKITTISPEGSQGNGHYGKDFNGNSWNTFSADGSTKDHIYLQLDPYTYRDTSPSPASSPSSRSWFSDASSCDSLQQIDDFDSELNEAASHFSLNSPLSSPRGSPRPWPTEEQMGFSTRGFSPGPLFPSRQSSCPSPRDENWLSPQTSSRSSSRPNSPCGKRRYSNSDAFSTTSPHLSPVPSPSLSRRGSFTDESSTGDSSSVKNPSTGSSSSSSEYGTPEIDSIPQKARKTSAEQTVALMGKENQNCNGSIKAYSPMVAGTDEGSGSYCSIRKESTGMDYLAVPSPLTWSKARIGGHSPIFRTSALPPLDWPLPSQYEHYELKIEVQPRTHHRAHYETEGSRGAVKASPGGHPVVKLLGYNEKPLTLQMFIGTADERNLRPHAFYQVHRITGKMVATTSYEAIVSGTKILEITLQPESNMTANIDCAGILKLRNSDIELRKGETDIGRKNTRVRLVFRVHVPQGNGKVVSLQTASVPIECSQRSAQELPQVDTYSTNACSVSGGEELVLTGSNFLPESKVIFIEKGPDGKLQWEEEALVNRAQSNESSLVLEVPQYVNKRITRPVQVVFYVSNGKRKRSPTQCFKYLPVIFKEEPNHDMHMRTSQPQSTSVSNSCNRTDMHLRSFPNGPMDPGVGNMGVMAGHQRDNFLQLHPSCMSMTPPASFPPVYSGSSHSNTTSTFPDSQSQSGHQSHLLNITENRHDLEESCHMSFESQGSITQAPYNSNFRETLPSGFQCLAPYGDSEGELAMGGLLLPHLQRSSSSPSLVWGDSSCSSPSPSQPCLSPHMPHSPVPVPSGHCTPLLDPTCGQSASALFPNMPVQMMMSQNSSSQVSESSRQQFECHFGQQPVPSEVPPMQHGDQESNIFSIHSHSAISYPFSQPSTQFHLASSDDTPLNQHTPPHFISDQGGMPNIPQDTTPSFSHTPEYSHGLGSGCHSPQNSNFQNSGMPQESKSHLHNKEQVKSMMESLPHAQNMRNNDRYCNLNMEPGPSSMEPGPTSGFVSHILEDTGQDAESEKAQYESAFQSIPIQGITFEEVSEIIGHDLTKFADTHCEETSN
ncbi:nuclear factor of activated T-cells, cytoplasmic 4 [Protopterus annectens]|uniref:nuclear factor of activated T-cells, cytoplasmic 4 n=1 Tax=Protopterus annectens TaxID=7888 RepID=UPI001CF94D71|nr:nuclear factor of activated T-cells, cytoplasmic 4 [Protopterus annectens]